MRFDASLRDGWSEAPDGWRYTMPEGWMQGRSVFGGLTAAVAAGLARRAITPERRLRTLTVNLIAPVSPGPVDGALEILREGGSTTFAAATLRQGGLPVATASLLFARPRRAGLVVPARPAPRLPDPETLEDLPYIPGVLPEFTQHVVMRWAEGNPPFSEGESPRFSGYCRYRVPAGDVEALIGMLDFWPCPSLSMLSTPAPASTVTWTAHLLAVPESFDGWFAFEYETVAGEGGFHTVVGRLYGPDGALLGWTEQLAAVFD